MFRKITGYICTVLLIFLVALYTMNYELMYASLFILLLPLLDYIFVRQSANNMDVKIDVKKIMLKKGDVIPIVTRVNNRGIMPIAMIEFNFECENMLHGISRKIQLRLPVLRWGKQECIFRIQSMYCGDINITLENVKCLDYLGLLSRNIVKNFKKKVYVLPIENNVELLKVDNYIIADIEGKEFSKEKPGDDPSEVFDIREYRPGDKLHSIHWKLSARKGQYMVKDYSLPINSNYSIVMDLTHRDKENIKEIDAIIETTMDMVLQFQEQGLNHQIIAYERAGRNVFKEIIDISDSIVEVMYKIYQSKVYKNRNLLLDYDANNEVNDETNVIYISSYISREKLEEFDRTFTKASKVYIYLHEGEEELEKEFYNICDIDIVDLNINELNHENTNIRI